MPLARTRFTSENAPCGRSVDGERHEDRDRECMLTEDLSYACGCRSISHEYHDGTWSRKVVHHNGSVLVDEFLSAE